MSETQRIVLDADTVLDAAFAGTFSHWRDVRGDAIAPALTAFRLDDLDTVLVPWSVLVDVHGDPATDDCDFHFRFWGTKRAELIGAEMTGKLLSAISSPFMRDANKREYQEVCRLAKPLLCNTPVVTSTGRNTVFQSMRLPLSNNGTSVTNVFSAVNYTRIAQPHYEYFGTEPPIKLD